MATADYIISNQSGASFRTDLNNTLAAIVSNNSNSSEPSTKYAYQWWADTSNAVMKIRNSSNDGWVELFQLDGTLTLEDGSASTPALAFRDDLNTGIFSSAADNFDIATGGTVRFNINGSITKISDILDTTVVRRQVQNSSVHVSGGNETNDGANIALYGSAHSSQADNIQFRASATNTFKIDSNGKLLVGTTSSRDIGGYQSAFQISGTSSDKSSFSIINNVNDANAAILFLAKQRSGSVGGTTIVQDNDEIGVIRFIASDGSDMAHRIAQISAEIDGTPGTNDLPGRLVFKTTQDGTTTHLERMSIGNTGNVLIGVQANVSTSDRGRLAIDCEDLDAAADLTNAAKYGLVFLNSPTANEGNGIAFFNDSGSTCGGAIIHVDKGSANIGQLQFFTSATSNTPTLKFKITEGGQVLIGVSSSVSAEAMLQAFGSSSTSFIFGNTSTSATGTATINMCPSNSVTGGQIICTATEDFSVSANRSANLKFNVRLNGTFYTAVEFNTSAQALFESITNSGNHFQINNTTTSNTGCMFNINSSRNTTNGSYFLAQWGSTSATRFQVNDGGTVQSTNNSYGSISDQTLKENIVDSGSQWDDIKNIKVRKFNFIETTDPDKKTMLGVVAQEAETVCPNLVETSKIKQNGEEKEYKTFKYSILYMKAIKCLQEAQSKIEVLETKVAALEAA